MLLIAFADGDEEGSVTDNFVAEYSFPRDLVFEAIERLCGLGLLVEGSDESHRRTQSLLSEWAAFGWVDSADYHLATRNYPFVDYSVDGRKLDFERMVSYVRSAPDLERTKAFSKTIRRYPAPTTSVALSALDEPFSTVWLGQPDLEPCTRQRCLLLLSVVYGQLRTRSLADDKSLMADAIGKTSPSGGSRHPTEAYLFAFGVRNLENGIYHFNVADSTLDKIRCFDASAENLQRLFSGPLRASFKVHAIIVMTSVFERSMYRYREPRSFRAIYMDVGHLSGTLDVTAKALHMNCLVQHGLNDRAVGELLGLDLLTEGVIYGAAIGGSSSPSVSELSTLSETNA
ncbi:SagB/ThcOx family dehydrogenase [Rhizobium phaseoli]|uniref:SagB/ThcOx family dehydrogenase n=1 Tax=Rhizobium phaseoli TaxID=396 RepID=UPI0013DFBF60|nr:SagB/ThcOx family dehydrogenase [Rhizobium phaseoli]